MADSDPSREGAASGRGSSPSFALRSACWLLLGGVLPLPAYLLIMMVLAALGARLPDGFDLGMPLFTLLLISAPLALLAALIGAWPKLMALLRRDH